MYSRILRKFWYLIGVYPIKIFLVKIIFLLHYLLILQLLILISGQILIVWANLLSEFWENSGIWFYLWHHSFHFFLKFLSFQSHFCVAYLKKFFIHASLSRKVLVFLNFFSVCKDSILCYSNIIRVSSLLIIQPSY